MSRITLSQQTNSNSSNTTPNPNPNPKYHKQDINGIHTILHQIQNDQNNFKNRSAVYTLGSGKSSDGRKSVEFADQTFKLTQTNSSFFSKKTETTSRSHGRSQIDDQQSEDDFQCPSCFATGQHPCITCGDNGAITKDSSLIKFLSYVIEFKLGKKPSYFSTQPPPRLSSSPSKPKSNPMRQSQPVRSIRASGNLQDSAKECPNIHYGYFCNSCNNEQPIEGTRYTCLFCEDYDQCEVCYKQRGHRHLMTQIKVSPNFRHSLNCWERMEKGSEMGSEKVMKGMKGRIEQLKDNIYNSSIR